LKSWFKVSLVVLVVFLLIVPLLGTACSKEEVTPTSTPTSTNVATPTPTKVATPTPTQSTTTTTPAPTQSGLKTVEVPIGVMAMTTGAQAAAGTAAARQVELVVEDINQTGFMVGNTLCKFKLIMDDYAYDSAKAVTVIRKHILQDGVKFEMALGSAGIVAAQPYTEDAKVLLMAGATGGSYTGPQYPLTFCPAGAYEASTPVCMRYIQQKYPSYKKVYNAVIDMELTRKTQRQITNPAMRYLGYQIVGEEFYPMTTTDFYPIIDRILAANPDIVVDASSQVLTKQLRDRGFKGIIYEGGTLVPVSFSAFVGGSPNTDLVFYPAINERDPSLPAAMQDFIARYNAKYGEYPQGGSFYVMPALYSLAQAMTLAGTYADTAKVAKALETGTFTCPLGEIKYGGAELFGVNHIAGPPTVLNQFLNGVSTVVMTVPADDAMDYMLQIYAAIGGRPQ
jgi:ABC-type branched-subunit amino acid transport system substrate-binding protein